MTIPINTDELLEGAEMFTATLTPTPGSGTLIGADNAAEITITDSTVAPPAVEFADASVTLEVAESAAAVELVLEIVPGNVAGAVLVTPVSGSAVAGEDFAAAGVLVDIDAGAESLTVSIPITNDGLPEATETFTVVITPATPGSAVIGNNSVANVTVTDSTNAGTLQFSLASLQVDEAAGQIEVEVSRLGGTDGDVNVSFRAVDASAVNGEDYQLIEGQLSWPAGDNSSRSFVVTLLDDPLPEPTESFELQLFGATPLGDDIQLGANSRVTVEILDNGDDFGRIRFVNSNSPNVSENDGTVRIEVERIESFSGNVMVDYETRSGSAIAGADFEAQTGRLIWETGDESRREIIINLLDDSEAEAAEDFTVALVRAFPVNTEAQLAEPFIHTVQLNEDRTFAGQFVISSNTTMAPEGELLELTIERVGGSEGPAFVSVGISGGSATQGEDFILQEGQLNWVAGETGSRTISLQIIDDGIAEPEEMITIQLFDAGPVGDDTQLGDNRELTITIPEQVADPGIIAFAASEIRVDEEASSVSLLINRVGGTDLQVSASFTTVDGTAIAGTDYVAASGTVAWQPGDATPRQIVIDLVDDFVPEEDEIFSVQLAGALPLGNDVQFDGRVEATVTILDIDQPLDDALMTENPFRLEIIGVPEQSAEVGDEVVGLGFRVADSRENGAVASGITVNWSVEPAGAVEFPDGTVTVSDSEGVTTNRVIVTGTGFIRIIAEAVFNTSGNSGLSDAEVFRAGMAALARPALQTRIDTPVFDVPNGSAFFTLRVGLETAPGITQNQSQTGMGLDNACLELNGIAANTNLTGNTNDAGGNVDAQTQQDLIDTCEALEVSPNLATDLDRVSHEELFVFSDTVIDTSDLQVTNVYSRINAIRAGRIETLDLSGLSLSVLDESIPGNVVNAAQNALYDLATGGGAAADAPFGGRLGFFANGAIGIGELDGQGRQQNADIETSGLTIGADYRFTDEFVLGAGIGITHNETDFTSSGGGAVVDGLSLTFFGTWFRSETGYLDLVLDVGSNSYEVERQINLTSEQSEVMARGETDANFASLTLGVGRNFTISEWDLGPYLRYSATRASVDGYSETASNREAGFGSVLDVRGHDASSSLLSLGGQISRNVSTKRAVFVPQFRFEFETQTERVKEGIPATFQADPNDTVFVLEGSERDTNYVNYGIGTSVVMKGGHSGFLFVEGRAADDNVRQNWLKLGYRYEIR